MNSHLPINIRFYQPTDYVSFKNLYLGGGLFYDGMDSEDILKESIEEDPQSILIAEMVALSGQFLL